MDIPLISYLTAIAAIVAAVGAAAAGRSLRRRQPRPTPPRPGSAGEHALQARYGTTKRAAGFYQRQMLDRLNPPMAAFIARQELLFVATADAAGACDCSIRCGPAGFIQVLDEHTLRYPEYRGNGVMGSLGNIYENPHIGLLFVDFTTSLIGLHVNGTARIADLPAATRQCVGGARAARVERLVEVHVEEAYIHCRKHLPRMVRVPGDVAWGTDDVHAKGGDFFDAAGEPRPWAQRRIDRDGPA